MIKLVCFDLDDTLIQKIHSVMLPCMLNGKLEQLIEIEKLENNGCLNWIEADYQKAVLMTGLPVEKLKDGFSNTMKPLMNINQTVSALRIRGIQSIVITSGPRQVANIAKNLWDFDAAYGSDYEVVDGVFSGRILEHIGDKGKISCLRQHCLMSGLSRNECIAIGDGSTDIPLFEYCHKSIAINASAIAVQKATYSINTQNLADILQFI